MGSSAGPPKGLNGSMTGGLSVAVLPAPGWTKRAVAVAQSAATSRTLATAPRMARLLLAKKISAHSNKRVGASSYASFALETIDDGFLQPPQCRALRISPLSAMQADFELACLRSPSILPPLGSFASASPLPMLHACTGRHRSTVKPAPAPAKLDKEQQQQGSSKGSAHRERQRRGRWQLCRTASSRSNSAQAPRSLLYSNQRHQHRCQAVSERGDAKGGAVRLSDTRRRRATNET